ncbi:MAG: dephospho-CoA kinase [Verrucomicrobiae bacterium]|nr:dephospho-CoA kinase [Verrucomicrobiae bacterium]
MKVLGLTGGVGMGKSAVAAELRRRGVAVADADEYARQVVHPGEPALQEIAEAFGPRFITSAGELDRAALAELVFSNLAARRKLEEILHPRIRRMWRQQVDQWRLEGRQLGVVIVPLLYEIGAEAEFDAVICVACTERTQYARLRARGWTDRQIRQRVQAQLPVEDKMARADFVVWTEGELGVVAAQLDRILSAVSVGAAHGNAA